MITRRSLLGTAGGLGALIALGGCTAGGGPMSGGPASGASAAPSAGGPLVTTTAAEVDDLLGRIDRAFQGTDTDAFLALLGDSDKDFWRRVHQGIHKLPLTSLSLNRQAQGGLEQDRLQGRGRLELGLAGNVAHQIADVDKRPTLQQTNILLIKDGPDAPLRMRSLDMGKQEPFHPWEIDDLTVRTLPHVVLQARPGERPLLERYAEAIEQGVARAHRTIAGGAVPRVSFLLGWKGDDQPFGDGRHLYGDSVVISRGGVTMNCITNDAASSNQRVLLRIPAGRDLPAEAVESVAAHEATHAFALGWGHGQAHYQFLEEGYATWVELLGRTMAPRYWETSKAYIDEAVRRGFWTGDFQEGPPEAIGAHYYLARSFYEWVAETRGEPQVHALARAFHASSKADAACQQVLGADVEACIARWAEWAKAR